MTSRKGCGLVRSSFSVAVTSHKLHTFHMYFSPCFSCSHNRPLSIQFPHPHLSPALATTKGTPLLSLTVLDITQGCYILTSWCAVCQSNSTVVVWCPGLPSFTSGSLHRSKWNWACPKTSCWQSGLLFGSGLDPQLFASSCTHCSWGLACIIRSKQFKSMYVHGI